MGKQFAQSRLTQEECVQIIRKNLSDLQQRYGVISLAIFGSFARNQHHKHSDVDVLVNFAAIPSLFTLIRVENHLSKRLGRKVDLVMENSIRPAFRQRIAQDIIWILK